MKKLLYISFTFLWLFTDNCVSAQENTLNDHSLIDYCQLNRLSRYKLLPDSIDPSKNLSLEDIFLISNQKKLIGTTKSSSVQKENNIQNILNKKNGNWPKIYHDEINAPSIYLINSYDCGYLITGRVKPNYPRYCWLIKTDINGEVLWEKTIGNGINTIILNGIGMNAEGSIYLSGSTMIEDDYGYSDPFVMKLNACGEKEWCRVFITPNHPDYGKSLCITSDGGCAMLLSLTGENLYDDRICFARFNSSGDLLWKHCYNSDGPMGNEYGHEVIVTTDMGFLITGVCQYSNPEDSLAWLCPYYIKTDPLGNFEWETIAGLHPFDVGGQGWMTVLSPDSTYYYSSISHYYRNSTAAPALLKMDMLGNVVGVYDIASPNDIGKLVSGKFISDSTLVASAAWGPYYNSVPKAIIIDTLGNRLNEQVLMDNNYLAATATTIDDKYLFYTQAMDEGEEFDAYLFKLNQNLLSDSIYTQPFTYDSLCDGEIVSDTIVQDDCGLIVGMEEIYTPKSEPKNKVVIYPNPAKDRFTVQSLPAGQAGSMFEVGGCRIEVFDLFGRKVVEVPVSKDQTEIEVTTVGWNNGLYVVRVVSKNGIIGSGKVLIR